MRTNPNDAITPIYDEFHDSVGNIRTATMGAGLTKREHFAALAMQGILASDEEDSEEHVAQVSVYLADALIAALNRGSK